MSYDARLQVWRGDTDSGAVGCTAYVAQSAGSGCESFNPGTTTPPSALRASCDGLRATIVGTEAVDVLMGTPGADVIAGGPGRDRIRARDGRRVALPLEY